MKLLLFAFLAIIASANASNCYGEATYTLTIEPLYRDDMQDENLPANIHFSDFVGVTHSNENFPLYEGFPAYNGPYEYLAENGDTRPLFEYVAKKSLQEGGGTRVFSGSKGVEFTVYSNVTYASAIGMVAPSPDWVAGGSYDFCDEYSGAWKTEPEDFEDFFFYAWDMGTDNGTTFEAADIDWPSSDGARMWDGINYGPSGFNGEPLAKGTWKYIGGKAKCEGEAYYSVKLRGTWRPENTPGIAYPGNAHFSPLIGLVHTDGFRHFEDGSPASFGLEDLAETGSTDDVLNNYVIMVNEGFTSMVDSVVGPTDEGSDALGESYELSFRVTEDYPMVSFLSMVAPSPDWFVASRVNFCDGSTGKWATGYHTASSSLFDAGTEEGMEFSTDNPDTRDGVVSEGPDNVFVETFADFEYTFIDSSDPKPAGCTYMNAANFDYEAQYDNGSCQFRCDGNGDSDSDGDSDGDYRDGDDKDGDDKDECSCNSESGSTNEININFANIFEGLNI